MPPKPQLHRPAAREFLSEEGRIWHSFRLFTFQIAQRICPGRRRSSTTLTPLTSGFGVESLARPCTPSPSSEVWWQGDLEIAEGGISSLHHQTIDITSLCYSTKFPCLPAWYSCVYVTSLRLCHRWYHMASTVYIMHLYMPPIFPREKCPYEADCVHMANINTDQNISITEK